MDLLFDLPGKQPYAGPAAPASSSATRRQALSQYFTPVWAARALWAAHFSHLGAGDRVLEPTCGPGRILRVIPADVDAFGIEIDPELAAEARRVSGREVITGDVLAERLPALQAVMGNPPFSVTFMDQLLERLSSAVVLGGRVGLIVPAYFTQTPSTVVRWNRAWSLLSEVLPRTLFPGLSMPLSFVLFERSTAPVLSGLRLFLEAAAVDDLAAPARRVLCEGQGTWRAVVLAALRELGGRAHLSALYAAIGARGRRTGEHWREKVRQTLQRGSALFRPRGGGEWELVASATAA